MNAKDRKATDLVRKLADDMMNAKPKVNPVVRNTDIIEALIGDLGALANGYQPKEMVRLTELAISEGEMERPDYLPAPRTVATGRIHTDF